MEGRSRPSVGELALAGVKGLETAPALCHPVALQLAHACWASLCPGAGSGGGAYVHSHQAGGLRPLVFCQPLSFPLSALSSCPSLGHVDALQACRGAPVLPTTCGRQPPGTKGGGAPYVIFCCVSSLGLRPSLLSSVFHVDMFPFIIYVSGSNVSPSSLSCHSLSCSLFHCPLDLVGCLLDDLPVPSPTPAKAKSHKGRDLGLSYSQLYSPEQYLTHPGV